MHKEARRGEIWYVDWSPGRGSEQTGLRPAVVIQTDAANCNPRYPNTIVLTVSTKGKAVPFHVPVNPSEGMDSFFLWPACYEYSSPVLCITSPAVETKETSLKLLRTGPS